MYDVNALIMSHRRLIDTELKMHIKTALVTQKSIETPNKMVLGTWVAYLLLRIGLGISTQ